MTRMLSVSPLVDIALDPFLPLFRSYRSAIIRHHGSEKMRQTCNNPDAPFADYYFSQEQLDVLDAIQNAPLDVPFQRQERPALLDLLRQRARLSSGDLVPLMDSLVGDTYRDFFLNGLRLIQKTRKGAKTQWVGLHENWTVEFLLPLANAFPEGRFLIILRDPRAVIASNLHVSNSSERGHIASYARCIRKQMACALYYQTLPVFRNRLVLLRYEDLIRDPEGKCKELCRFLEIPFHPDMLDTHKYVDPATGETYNGYSSFEPVAHGFKEHRIGRWRQHLPNDQVRLIDFICGFEMEFFGYEPLDHSESAPLDPGILSALIKDGQEPKSWRTDFGLPEKDYGFEFLRRGLLLSPDFMFEEPLVRKAFLYKEVYSALKTSCHRT